MTTAIFPPLVNGQVTLTDTDVENEIDNIYTTVGVSQDDMIVVFLPPTTPPPVVQACGQHLATSSGHLGAWISYPGVAGCSFAFQQEAIVHEVTETAANPATSFGVSYEGWDQGTGAVCEIADMCASNSFSVQTQPASHVPSRIQTQQMMSNESIAAGSDGCIYGRSTAASIFGLGSNNDLYESSVQATTSLAISSALSWGKPSGVTLTGTPAAASWGPGRLDAFVRATTGQIYHASSDNSGSTVTWEKLTSSASFTQSPDAVSWGAGNIQVFGVQGTKIVKNTMDYGGAWSGWQTVTGPSGVTPSSKVTVASWGASITFGVLPSDNRTVVAAFRGSDGKVWIGHATGTGSFTWKSFAAPAALTGDPDLSAWAPPRLDLFVLDTSGNFWDMWSDDGSTIRTSSKWVHPSQGGFQVGAGVAALGDGRMIAGGRVGTGTPYVQFWNWHGTNWVSVGGPFVSGIDIASP